MTYPVIYDVTYSYSVFQQSQGNNAFPGTQVDGDLAGLADSLANLSTFMQGVMRSDGALQNGIVTYDSLAPSLQTAGLAPATAWATGVSYLAGNSVVINSNLYRLATPHTSGVFATDLAAGNWTFVTALAQGIAGADGPQGAQGPAGADGADGADAGTICVSLNSDIAAIGASRAALTIVNAQTLTADLTIPANVQLIIVNGGSIAKAGAFTLTILGQLSAPLTQVFSGFSAGDVVLASSIKAHPEWWGALGDNANDDYAAIQSAVSAFPNGAGSIEFKYGPYRVSDTISVTESFITFEGQTCIARQTGVPTIVSTDSTKPALSVLGTTAGGNADGTLENFVSRNVYYSRLSMGAVGSITVSLVNVLFTFMDRGGASLSQTGLYIKNANSLYLDHWGATIGGDLAGQPVYGVRVDGALQGSAGVVSNDFEFFGSSSPTASDSYAYHDVAAGTAASGDRIFTNFKTSGDVDYGFWLQDAGGFAADVHIKGIVMDSIKKGGIVLTSVANAAFQQASITSAWINLTNSSGTAYGIKNTLRAQTNIAAVTVEDSFTGTGSNILISLIGSQNCTISGVNFTGSTSLATLQLLNSGATATSKCSIGQVTNPNTGTMYFTAATQNTLSGVNNPSGIINLDATSNNNKMMGIFGATVNGGAGNTFL